MKAHFRQLNCSSLFDSYAEASCKSVSNAITRAMHRFTPCKILVQRPTNPPWWGPECEAAVQAKERAWCMWKSRPGNDMYRSLFIASVNHTEGVLQHSQLVAEAKVPAKLSSGSLPISGGPVKRAAGEVCTSSIPLLIGEDGTEHNTARKS